MAKSYTITELQDRAKNEGWTPEDLAATIDDARNQGRLIDEPQADTTPNIDNDNEISFSNVMGAIYPRTKKASEERSFKNMAIGSLKDALSLPGRVLSAIPESIGPTSFLQELAKISPNEKTGIIGKPIEIIEGTIKDPSTIPSLAVGGPIAKAISKVGGLVAKPAIAAATRGLAEGATSAAIRAAGPEQTSTGEKIGEVAISGTLPFVGSLASAAKKGLAKKGVGLVENIQEQGGIDPEAFRMATTKEGQKQLSEAYGKHFEYAQNILSDLRNFDDFVPEAKQIKEILPQLPEQDISPIIEHLYKYVKPNAVGDVKAANNKILSLIDDIKNKYTQTYLNPISGRTTKTTISAIDLYGLRKQLDDIASDAFTNQSPSQYAKAARDGRTVIKNMLIDASKESNPEYAALMKSWSNKLQKKEKIESFIGDDLVKQPERIATFVESAFRGKGKPYRQDILKDLQDIMGADYISKIKVADYAGQIGEQSGRLPLRPPIKTGYSKMDLLSFPFKSPRIAGEFTYPYLNKLSNKEQFVGGNKTSAAMQALRSSLFNNDTTGLQELSNINMR